MTNESGMCSNFGVFSQSPIYYSTNGNITQNAPKHPKIWLWLLSKLTIQEKYHQLSILSYGQYDLQFLPLSSVHIGPQTNA